MLVASVVNQSHENTRGLLSQTETPDAQLTCSNGKSRENELNHSSDLAVVLEDISLNRRNRKHSSLLVRPARRACTQNLFMENGQPLPFEEARHSGLAVGVPGMVDTWGRAVHRLRPPRLRRRPAARHPPRPARLPDRRTFRAGDPGVAGRPAGVHRRAGSCSCATASRCRSASRLRNPDLARTYRLLAAARAALPLPRPARRGRSRTPCSTRRCGRAPRSPSGRASCAAATWRSSTSTSPRRPTCATAAATSTACRRRRRAAPPPVRRSTSCPATTCRGDRALALHHYLESLRYSFADRNRYVGDPRYVDVPLHGLLDPAYAATRRCLITDHAADQPGRARRPVPAVRAAARPPRPARPRPTTSSRRTTS